MKYFKRGITSLEKNIIKKQNVFNFNIQKKAFSSLDSLEIIQTKIDKNSQVFQVRKIKINFNKSFNKLYRKTTKIQLIKQAS